VWAAQKLAVPLTVFASNPEAVKAAESAGRAWVKVQAVEDAHGCCAVFCARTGALMPAADDRFVAAGVATWVRDMWTLVGNLTTVVIPSAGDGLLLGTVAAARHFGLTTVVVTPDTEPVDPAVTAVLAGENLPGLAPSTRPVQLESVRVSAEDVYTAARGLRRRADAIGTGVGTEGATALAALTSQSGQAGRGYRPHRGEVVAVLLSAADIPSLPARGRV
jgi:threonine dehydratase